MTQEDKELLLKDLCARLLYGVKVHKENSELDGTLVDTELRNGLMVITTNEISVCTISTDECKPYLRTLSSMTEEEKIEFWRIEGLELEHVVGDIKEWQHFTYQGFDWLNEHHFDYRGLIEKGLALEAPEGMYN